jgi:hypothetical protein
MLWVRLDDARHKVDECFSLLGRQNRQDFRLSLKDFGPMLGNVTQTLRCRGDKSNPPISRRDSAAHEAFAFQMVDDLAHGGGIDRHHGGNLFLLEAGHVGDGHECAHFVAQPIRWNGFSDGAQKDLRQAPGKIHRPLPLIGLDNARSDLLRRIARRSLP